MASLVRGRRSYVGPRAFRPRFPSVSVPAEATGPILTGGVALTITLTSFVARGGSQLVRTTWMEVALILTGAILCAVALLAPRPPKTPERLRGGLTLAAFAALAAFTTFSITWSLMPNDSWFEADRTLAYLAAFAGGLSLGRLVPDRWSAMLKGVALGVVIVCFCALLTKVFPSALAANETFARLSPPYDYWNGVGLIAALGLPPLLWLAARRSGHAAVNVLAWPATGLVVMALMLSFSRGALLATAFGLTLWIAVVPLRMRILVALGGVLVATLPLVAWAFAQEGIAKDEAPMALRVDAGQALGALLLLLLVALTVAGLIVGFLSAHRPPSERARTVATRGLIAALLVVPAVAILMLANAPGGISGQVSKAWKQATDPAVAGPTNGPSRLKATSSARARYWGEALKVHAQAPLLGTGAGAYGTLRERYRVDTRTVQHAHGYVVQTLADLGWVGLALSLLAAVAWLLSAARVLGMRVRDRGLLWDAERVGVAALACSAFIFGVHSAIDWTWFIPGNAVTALLCAGWVVSRPTLRERYGGLPAPVPRRRSPYLVASAGLIVMLGVATSWAALQPVRSSHAESAALERLEIGALPQAASIAKIAHERNPLSVEPLFDTATIEVARNQPDVAERALMQTIDLEPANPETWRRLAFFRLNTRHDPRAALRAYQAAYFLDPHAARSVVDVIETARLVNAKP